MLLLVSSFAYVKGQNGYYYLGGQAGLMINRGYTATLHLDFPTSYFNSFELFANYYNKKDDPYKSFVGGLVYKPVLARNKNTIFRARFGGALGSGGDDRQDFIVGPELGLELSQTLYNNIDLVLSNKNQYLFRADSDKWRVGIELGVRFPL